MSYEILVPRKEIEYIARNFTLTTHALKRLKERTTKYDVEKMILNSPLWWRTRDGCINIATDESHVFVVGKVKGRYQIVTYHEKSRYGFSVIDKFTMSYFGLERKPKKKKGKRNVKKQKFRKIYNFKSK